ncbi:EamA family transporter [Pedobacter frigiditerrae]|uniref:EamA family transporter n=1 Tax=Pedobacter frigiditerrae TaxID=2530452 RepID=A0A4R0MYH3_9SPHI|nr:EamA family transporter [Pedobacter frigiditerrae]TCC92381.1 EamA family transporter [Pedobacter frigiditerrae]
MKDKLLPGLLFAICWSTGSVAAKFGIQSADALILASLRFIGTGIILSPYFIYRTKRAFLPPREEWKHVIIYGILNTTLTLGAFFAAQKYVTSGVSMLFIAIAPLLISLLSSILLKRKLSIWEIVGMLVAFAGLVICSMPEINNGKIKLIGIVYLLIYIISYAISSVYYSKARITVQPAVFNIWQVFIGGIVLLPISFLLHSAQIRFINATLFISLGWMIIILSFTANLLWLFLIKKDAVAAAAWLYLTPVFGYLWGFLFLKESIDYNAVAGTVLVIVGLVIAKKTEKART